MADPLIQSTTTSYGSRVLNSFKSMIIGLVLFLVSFGLLYWNEGRVDFSLMVKKAKEINAMAPNTNPLQNGDLVFATGIFSSNEVFGDQLFLKPDKFIAVERTVEMYAWTESTESKSKTNVGGSETTETNYQYSKAWVEYPPSSSHFKYPQGHENPLKAVDNADYKARSASLGIYTVDMSSVTLPSLIPLSLTRQNTILNRGAVLVNDRYIFVSHHQNSQFDHPQVGDWRVSYQGFYSGNTASLFGKLDQNRIGPYFDKKNHRLYRIFTGTRLDALATLHQEYTLLSWMLRLAGFFMMWVGLYALFSPISALLDALPIFGTLGRTVIGIVTLLVALVLTLITILVSMVIHNVVALILALIITFALILGAFRSARKNKALKRESSIDRE